MVTFTRIPGTPKPPDARIGGTASSTLGLIAFAMMTIVVLSIVLFHFIPR
jgi:hypothetical protein